MYVFLVREGTESILITGLPGTEDTKSVVETEEPEHGQSVDDISQPGTESIPVTLTELPGIEDTKSVVETEEPSTEHGQSVDDILQPGQHGKEKEKILAPQKIIRPQRRKADQHGKENEILPRKERAKYFKEAQDSLVLASGFTSFKFKQICTQVEIDSSKFHLPIPKTENAREVKIDMKSCDLYPKDGLKGYLPRMTKADGNCLFHAASQLTFGDDNMDTELRVRAIVELMVHEDVYLDEEFLQKGFHGKAMHTPIAYEYAQYLENYKMQPLNKKEVQRLFR